MKYEFYRLQQRMNLWLTIYQSRYADRFEEYYAKSDANKAVKAFDEEFPSNPELDITEDELNIQQEKLKKSFDLDEEIPF